MQALAGYLLYSHPLHRLSEWQPALLSIAMGLALSGVIVAALLPCFQAEEQ